MENRTDLNDVTFIIPVRIDSDDRLENLYLVIDYLKENFDTKIMVLEADTTEKVKNPEINSKIFIEDSNPVFHRTKYLNRMTIQSATPYVAIWDTDVLLPKDQIIKSVNLLRDNLADMVLPYDGRVYNTPEFMKKVFHQSGYQMYVFNEYKDVFHLMYGIRSVGGALVVNKQKYIESGLENENFFGWGPEDAERVKRWEILGYNIVRVEGSLFHLYHPRLQNSWFGSKELQLQNQKEFIKICRMSKEELIIYLPVISNVNKQANNIL